MIIKKSKPSKKKKPIGKVTKKWLKTRTLWLKNNPPNHQGYYICYICNKWIDKAEITIDHIIPRSKAPELRFDPSNLMACCYNCNNNKGSKLYGT